MYYIHNTQTRTYYPNRTLSSALRLEKIIILKDKVPHELNKMAHSLL